MRKETREEQKLRKEADGKARWKECWYCDDSGWVFLPRAGKKEDNICPCAVGTEIRNEMAEVWLAQTAPPRAEGPPKVAVLQRDLEKPKVKTFRAPWPKNGSMVDKALNQGRLSFKFEDRWVRVITGRGTLYRGGWAWTVTLANGEKVKLSEKSLSPEILRIEHRRPGREGWKGL